MISSYEWQLGDGSTASGVESLSHQYTGEGFYTVTVSVTDHLGNVGAATIQIAVTSQQIGAVNIVPITNLRAILLGKKTSQDETAVSIMEFFKPLTWEDSLG